MPKREKSRSNLEPYRRPKLPGRNEKCPCGSGKKAKRCCLDNIKALASLPPQVRQQFVVASILGRPVEACAGVVTTEEGILVPVENTEIVVNTPAITI